MTAVCDLLPGDKVPSPLGDTHTFVQRCPHPLYLGLTLVIWRLADGSWSHDALSSVQDVGEVIESTPDDRINALRNALIGAH